MSALDPVLEQIRRQLNIELPIANIRKLDQGLSNNSYLLDVGRRQAVLRIADPDRFWNTKPELELQVLGLAERAALCPKVLYASPKQGILVTEYVEAREITLTNPADIVAVAELLKQVHALDPVAGELTPRVAACHYWRQLEKSKDQASAQLAELKYKLDHIMSVAELAHASYCLCHNDLVADNILVTDKGLMLVDWEYAAMGDPYFDLAAFSYNLGLSEAQNHYLLECYLDKVTEQAQRHLLTSMIIYLYLDVLWYVLRAKRGKLLVDISEKVRRLKELVGEYN